MSDWPRWMQTSHGPAGESDTYVGQENAALCHEEEVLARGYTAVSLHVLLQGVVGNVMK